MKNSIFKATLTVFVLSLIAKILGFLKSIIQASYFGANIYTDAFNVANGFVSNILYMLVTAVSVAFIPLYFQNKQKDLEKRFATITLTLTSIISIALSIILVVLSPFIVRILVPTYSVEHQAITVKYFCVLVVGLVFALTANMYTSLLNAEKIYGYSTIGSVVNSVVLILFIVLFANSMGVWVLVISVPISYLIQWIILSVRGKKYASISLKYGIYDEKVKVLLIQTIPILLGQATVEINQMIDRSLLSSVGEGIVTAVSYSAVLYQFVVTLIGSPLQTVFFTELSEAGAQKNYHRIADLLQKCYKVILIVSMPITIVMLFGSSDIVNIVYGHGKFSADAVSNCSIGLQMYSFCLIPVCIKKALTRAYYSQNNTKRPMIFGVLEVLLNIGLSIWWCRYWGIYGVVGATAVASFVFVIIVLFDYNQKYSKILSISELGTYWRIVIAAILTILVLKLLMIFKFDIPMLSFVYKTLTSFGLFYGFLLVSKEPLFIYLLKSMTKNVRKKVRKN